MRDFFAFKKIAERVYYIKYIDNNNVWLGHVCDPTKEIEMVESSYEIPQVITGMLHQRNSDDGPIYWCDQCGFILDSGSALMFKLNVMEL